jgi:hypothetical protein
VWSRPLRTSQSVSCLHLSPDVCYRQSCGQRQMRLCQHTVRYTRTVRARHFKVCTVAQTKKTVGLVSRWTQVGFSSRAERLCKALPLLMRHVRGVSWLRRSPASCARDFLSSPRATPRQQETDTSMRESDRLEEARKKRGAHPIIKSLEIGSPRV